MIYLVIIVFTIVSSLLALKIHNLETNELRRKERLKVGDTKFKTINQANAKLVSKLIQLEDQLKEEIELTTMLFDRTLTIVEANVEDIDKLKSKPKKRGVK